MAGLVEILAEPETPEVQTFTEYLSPEGTMPFLINPQRGKTEFQQKSDSFYDRKTLDTTTFKSREIN